MMTTNNESTANMASNANTKTPRTEPRSTLLTRDSFMIRLRFA